MVTKGSVLVVDDEINLCRILGAKLAKIGYNVVAVHDGLQAVEQVRACEFDVVLLDLILPRMDGLSALAQIRDLHATLPVIVMTACENAEAVEQARRYGVSAYVNKPFDLDSLVSLVVETSRSSAQDSTRHLPESTVLFVKDQPVTLEILNGGGARVYSSTICHKNEHTLSVAAPVSANSTVEVAPRTAVRVGLAAGDAFYSFSSHVLRYDGDPDFALVLEKPGVIYRSQRRETPRVLLRIPVDYATCDPDTDTETEIRTGTGETRDVSLGGAKIVVPEEILPGEMIRVELRPKSPGDTISALAQVLRSRRGDESGDAGYVLGCRFTSTDDRLRKLLEE